MSNTAQEGSIDLTMNGDIQTSTQLVIAIDFGTTFTGVAYLHQGAQTGMDPHQIADRITVVRRWPNATGTFVEKTPTKIAYHTNPPAWGRQVRPTDQPQASFFKLGLEPRTEDYYRGRDPQAYSLIKGSRRPIQNKEPIDIAADYLTRVYAHIRQIFKDQFGETFLDTQPTIYVITVPAIWSDYAVNQTKEAARRAGIPLDKLRLVTEPEAAAHYCATKCEEIDLVEGDRFVVCDAGGGTVVSSTIMIMLNS
jgi:molecular chaperone DnaK (HSP70)